MNINWFASLAFLFLIETSKTESQDVRVKLCGREFIRMVVTLCGSSRLKRNVLQPDLHFANPHRNLQNWLDRDFFAHQKGTLSAEDEHRREHGAPDSVTEHPAPLQPTSPPEELLERSTTVQDLSMSSRTRRDVGPAGVCCTFGCTRSELIQYC